jgi:hypothetical protein
MAEHPIDRYQPGGAWGCCDRCNFQRRHVELRKEWTGLLVCSDCFDPRPADLSPLRIIPEGRPIRDARPDLLDILGPNTTTAADL